MQVVMTKAKHLLKNKKSWLLAGMIPVASGIISYAALSGIQKISTDPFEFPQILSASNSRLQDRPNRGQGVIVRTTDKTELARYAKNEGLDVLSSVNLPGKQALVTLESSSRSVALERMSDKAASIIVGEVYPNRTYVASAIPNDTYYPDQWNLPRVSAPAAWDTTQGSPGVTIAVLDSGILSSQTWADSGPYTHSDFPSSKIWTNSAENGPTTTEGPTPNCTSRGLVLDKSCNNVDDDGNGFIDDSRGWDYMGGWRGDTTVCPNRNDTTAYNNVNFPGYVSQDNDPQPYSCDDYTDQNLLNKDHFSTGCGYGEGACYVGHGTSVASVAGAATNSNGLVAGVDWNAKLMNLRVLDGYGGGDSASVAAAIEYATAEGADVINMSLALFTDDSCMTTDALVEEALSRAASAGIITVAASGNGGSRGVCYPANSQYAMAVGSSDRDDKRSSFSTYGPEIDVLAPGSSIPAANAPSAAASTNYRSNTNGTSLATPHVAGQAALLIAQFPDAGRSTIINKIKDTADKVLDMNGTSFTEQHGFGRINLYSSLANMGSKVPVYRLYNRDRNYHFYTTSAAERDRAVSVYRFRYEGIRFYARNTSSNTQPIYRLFRPGSSSHLFTTSASERDRAIDQNDFRDEGVGLRVSTDIDSPSRPIYRLYRPSTGSHFYTESQSERDRAVNEHGFRYEGIGFNAE